MIGNVAEILAKARFGRDAGANRFEPDLEVESVFATVRNRTRKSKGCLNRRTALAMVFRLMMSAKKKWRKINGPNRLPEVIQGIVFKDGIKQLQAAA